MLFHCESAAEIFADETNANHEHQSKRKYLMNDVGKAMQNYFMRFQMTVPFSATLRKNILVECCDCGAHPYTFIRSLTHSLICSQAERCVACNLFHPSRVCAWIRNKLFYLPSEHQCGYHCSLCLFLIGIKSVCIRTEKLTWIYFCDIALPCVCVCILLLLLLLLLLCVCVFVFFFSLQIRFLCSC